MRFHDSVNFSYIRIKWFPCFWNFISQISSNVQKEVMEAYLQKCQLKVGRNKKFVVGIPSFSLIIFFLKLPLNFCKTFKSGFLYVLYLALIWMVLFFYGFFKKYLFLFWWFCNTSSNASALITLNFDFNFGFWEKCS